MKKLLISNGLLLLAAALVYGLGQQQNWVEHTYARHWYPIFGEGLRLLTGWIPVSLGDILYGFFGLWLVVRGYRFWQQYRQADPAWRVFLQQSLQILRTVLVIYLIFKVFWGWQYNRPGLVAQLQLDTTQIRTAELDTLNTILAAQTNRWKQLALDSKLPVPSGKALFASAVEAYHVAEKSYPFLMVKRPVIKSSLWGWLGNYTGFLGYYNPFTGEAQVNTTVPGFSQPFTACHELGHQIGFAREHEANFVGYLAARSSPNPHVQYSMYLDMFLYANRTLYRIDSTQAKKHHQGLDSLVKKDLRTWRQFMEQHRNPFEPIVRWMYGQFLKQNQQPSGLLSYDEVTAFLIGFYRKFNFV